MPPSSNAVYLGIKGTVLALDRNSGRRLWTAKLKGDEFVNLLVDGDRLFATTCGEFSAWMPPTATCFGTTRSKASDGG